MKRINSILIAALAGLALSWFAGSTQAQVKGGEKLLQLNGSSFTSTITPSNSKPMSCAKCQDASRNVPDVTSSALGARTLVAHGVPTTIVASHQCGGCVTATATVGAGRHAKDVVNHRCSSCE